MDTLHCSTSFHCSTPLHCSTSLHCFTCQHCSTSFFEGALRCDNIMFLLIQESIPAISPARLLQTVYPSELLGTDSLMKDALQVSVMSSAHSLPPHSPPSILPLLPLILPLLPPFSLYSHSFSLSSPPFSLSSHSFPHPPTHSYFFLLFLSFFPLISVLSPMCMSSICILYVHACIMHVIKGK